MNEIKNILASRYASKGMKSIWSEEGKILIEREFWITVMKVQKELGIDIPKEAIDSYEKVKNNINIESINNRDRQLRHDVKARIEEFCELSGYQHIHKGLTSRDLTDNVEQYQVLKSLKLIKLKTIKAISLMSKKADEYKDIVISGRTHNVAAQPITLGKRIAMFGDEMFYAFENLENLTDRYSLRGIKGAVGTLLDLKTLFNNDSKKLIDFQNKVAKYLGFNRTLDCVGQVYPRSMDFEVVSSLYQLGSAPSSFCKTLRIMAGHETASEGFKKGQVGSSAMPHKMNSRNAERINGFHHILNGHVTMASCLSGDQWNEGDVSCSVVRRVVLPDAFFALDGILETFITILNEMTVWEHIIKAETEKYLPFLISTTILMHAVKKGIGREKAHDIIKKHSIEVINGIRCGEILQNDVLKRLGNDAEFPLNENELKEIMDNSESFLGEAKAQIKSFCYKAKTLTDKYPESNNIRIEELL